MPDRFRRYPSIDPKKCLTWFHLCSDIYPVKAITVAATVNIDMGKYLFCTDPPLFVRSKP